MSEGGFRLRSVTNRILLFSLGIIFLEISTHKDDPIKLFEVDFDQATSGLFQAFFGLVVIEATASLILHHVMGQTQSEQSRVRSAIEVLVRENSALHGSKEAALEPWQQGVLSEYDKIAKQQSNFFTSYHVYMPILVGILGILFSLPDMWELAREMSRMRFTIF